jgi:hypothetical protein
MIMVNPGGAQDATYTHHGPDDLILYAVSADVTTGAIDTAVEVRCVDQSGATIAHSRTNAHLDVALSGEVTFAPYLPDSIGLGFASPGEIIQTGLAATPLLDGSQVIVHPVENDAVVTEARLWVVTPEIFEELALGPIYLLPAGGSVEA